MGLPQGNQGGVCFNGLVSGKKTGSDKNGDDENDHPTNKYYTLSCFNGSISGNTGMVA